MNTPKDPKEPLPFSDVELEELGEREQRVVDSMSRDRVIAGLRFLASIDPEKMVAASESERKQRTEKLKRIAHNEGTLPLSQLKGGDLVTLVLEKPPKPPTPFQVQVDSLFDRAATRLKLKPYTRDLGKKAIEQIRELNAFASYPRRYIHAMVENVDKENSQVLLGWFSDSNHRSFLQNEIGPRSIHRDNPTILTQQDRFTLVGSSTSDPNTTDDFHNAAGVGILRQGDHPMISMHASRVFSPREYIADLEGMVVCQFSLGTEDIFPKPKI